jgi:predicted aspartyl protease
MEIILMILREMEHLKSLVRLTTRKKDSEATNNQVSMVSIVLALKKIYINKMHQSKTLHLLVEINNYVVERLVDTRASMFVMAATMFKELGIMHLVIGFEIYKITSRVITRAMGRIDEVPIKVGDI